jgi:hypothetical protein
MAERPRRGAGWSDATFVAVSALFTAIGLWMAWRGGPERRVGVGVTAFFGMCLAVAVGVVRQRASVRRSLGARSVRIVGSVTIPVRVGRYVALTGAVSAVLFTTAWALHPSIASVVSFATAILLVALLPVVAFGPPRRRAVSFEPGGLRLIEPRFAIVVPWDEIVRAWIVPIDETPLVAIDVRDPGRLAPEVGDRACARERAFRDLARLVRRNRTWLGCDLCIAPSTLGLDGVLLVRALETYVRDPGARRSLAAAPGLPPHPDPLPR